MRAVLGVRAAFHFADGELVWFHVDEPPAPRHEVAVPEGDQIITTSGSYERYRRVEFDLVRVRRYSDGSVAVYRERER